MPKSIQQKHLTHTMVGDATSGTGQEADAAFYSQAMINYPRDYSVTNRQNIEQTTRKGVPYTYAVQVTATGSFLAPKTDGQGAVEDIDGSGNINDYVQAGDGGTTLVSLGDKQTSRDATMIVRFFAPMSNWVMKNAAVKLHAAREHMYEKGLVPDESRGAYAHTVRYALESSTENYLDPLHSTTRQPFNGGTWDLSKIHFEPDTDGAHIKLSGGHADEETNQTHQILSLPQMYLASRGGKVEPDSNAGEFEQSKYSVLNQLLSKDTTDANPKVVDLAKGEQDNPPYDISDDTYCDFNQLVEVGRLQFNPFTAGSASTVIEVPFGICKVSAVLANNADLDANWSIDLSSRLLRVGVMG